MVRWLRRPVDRVPSASGVGTGSAASACGARLAAICFVVLNLAASVEAVSLEAAHGEATPSSALRDVLTLSELGTEQPTGMSLVPNRYFVAIGAEARAHHALEGTIDVPWTKMQNTAPWSLHWKNEGVRWFPTFSARFFTHGGHLVPIERGILCPSERHYWCVILSPGRVWSERADHGMSRASFPFVLVNEYSNDAHNGLATFLYDDDSISPIRFQIVQESSFDPYKFDAWGQALATFVPAKIEGRVKYSRSFDREAAASLPTGAWDGLAARYGKDRLSQLSRSVPKAELSAAGLVVDGVLYLEAGETRQGPYPYPYVARHGVYSVTKSMAAALALFRLSVKYGDEVPTYRIVDYVDVMADHDGWKKVTFADALNMATGVGEVKPGPGVSVSADEERPRFYSFIAARSLAEKLRIAFSYPDYPWGPGEVLRYSSINTFLLAAAMDRFLKKKEGPDADLWKMIETEVLEPIGIQHLPIMRTVEPDGRLGLPFLFMGIYPTVDDVAKLALLFQEGGVHGGRELLSPRLVGEAMRRSGPAGLPSGFEFPGGEGRYHLSLWSAAWPGKEGSTVHVPYMAGLGGHLVVLAPNGVTAFVLTDSQRSEVTDMIRAIEAILPIAQK